MTRDNLLDDLEALVAAATPGEWFAEAGFVEVECVDRDEPDVMVCVANSSAWKRPTTTQEYADAACIAALKNAAPELLRRCREHAQIDSDNDTFQRVTDEALTRAEKAEASRDLLAEALRDVEGLAAQMRSDGGMAIRDIARAALAKIDGVRCPIETQTASRNASSACARRRVTTGRAALS